MHIRLFLLWKINIGIESCSYAPTDCIIEMEHKPSFSPETGLDQRCQGPLHRFTSVWQLLN